MEVNTLTRKQITTTIDEDILKALRVYSAENFTDINKVLEDASRLWLTLKDDKSTFKDILDTLPTEGSPLARTLKEYIQSQADKEIKYTVTK